MSSVLTGCSRILPSLMQPCGQGKVNRVDALPHSDTVKSLTAMILSYKMTGRHSSSQRHVMLWIVPFSLLGFTGSLAREERPTPVVHTEFIFEKAPFPQCHASTIAE